MTYTQHPPHHQALPALLSAMTVALMLQLLSVEPSRPYLGWLISAIIITPITAWITWRRSTTNALGYLICACSITLALSLIAQPYPEASLIMLLMVIPTFAHQPYLIVLWVLPSLLVYSITIELNIWLPVWAIGATLLWYQSGLWQRFAKLKQIEQHRLKRQLQRHNNYDAITGLRNKQYFEKRLRQSVSEAKRSKTPLSLIVLDIDYFRAYNEHYGNEYGNSCLEQVARLIKSDSQRQSDLIARLNGGNYVLLLPGTDKHGANRLAMQILDHLARTKLENQGSPISRYVTLTQGISQWQPGVNAEQLLHRAQLAMFQAKHSETGRTTVA
ncbi:GGDEF domain-containing protein [Ferrimonas lipolytica]|uniref:diguanylate cyclase n=1 Tax=Ferrimonas lipolytica TaxID=2724191 RepID=A0A6H1UGT7_9GAMM|nr:GGDEF domain-containing protein [Ferrimonas lipolytica]QIZ78301.1 GGDEF domain-containing protein [Ferrimonas lipolytica]